ncbi:uncharacterized protein RHOBADRAFT_43832 [Rhodotorula graminis WP1]|uniref:Uncharacterized protein n=1 Tax=Rhodotorula graminis (strain WP1) TaxID=578459 RepID=A0A194S7D4_RHOGW|nr:uncharacterized protein RHOBADRAFT_43832 [Rhodotorula graminis WP1]KPV75326.1 hypothetical protein RHOBADRAFT_43832 [Rhodotorula graminis WP1]
MNKDNLLQLEQARRNNNPLRLVVCDYFYSNKKVLFDNIVGFPSFDEYMVVAEVSENSRAIELTCRSMARRSRSPDSDPTCTSRTRTDYATSSTAQRRN